mmetsp:Transcript_71293/g.127063  ORF Transcript_71293/g.127063 Transcript_71293/m.127063 type:complete len:954 (-) Transcript_71293:100-2961(-)
MDQAGEQCLQALQALYGSPDPNHQKQADSWLVQFQQTPAAWQVCDGILSRPDTPMQFRFFAAQTMRTKVQFDFYELPAESYASLRDSLLSHIDRFRSPEFAPIHTQLALATADLAIQMDSSWPEVVKSLFSRYGTDTEAYATLLELLRMLPEENMNMKLMTDTHKRDNTREIFQSNAPEVINFLLNLQCPSAQAKKKVLECFLSWSKFANLNASDLSKNPLVPECFNYIREAGELSETATDIIVELLRMSHDGPYTEAVAQTVLPLLSGLQTKFEQLCSCGLEQAVDNEVHRDALLQICRIYVETAEVLVPLIMQRSTAPEIQAILQVLCRCTDLPVPEISSIPLDFWHRLQREVVRHPEMHNHFQAFYVELLTVMIRRSVVNPNEDPFQADDDVIAYRRSLLNMAEDCLEVLTPNTALEHVLRSLQTGQGDGVTVQEAHFFCLTAVGPRAEVRDNSVLWQLIQSLPPLISQQLQDEKDAALLDFTKKTAIELLGSVVNWIKTKPDFLRSSLDMISTLLLASVPANSPPHILERHKQLQQTASIAFRDICVGGKSVLLDLVGNLSHLYVSTMHLPIRMHQFITEGVGVIVGQIRDDNTFRDSLEQIVTPLVTGLTSEREKPNILSEILDRMTTIIQNLRVSEGSAKAANVGHLVTNVIWPLVQQTLNTHPTDAKVVEKSCRVLKHSERCVPDLFKPIVSSVAQTLIPAFQQQQHSSYLYQAEILANTYAHDPEIVPVLTHLFHQLSTTALTVLVAARDQNRLEEFTELVEDFYGMFERYLRYAPTIVLEAPTLPATCQLWTNVIFVQQKDAIEAIIAFIEAVLNLIGEAVRGGGYRRAQYGQQLRPHVFQVAPGFMEALLRLIAGVPTRYVQDTIPSVLEGVRGAFPEEFPTWLEASFQHLPPSVASTAEKQKYGQQLIHGDSNAVYYAVSDICYRCEQVALRNRASSGSTTK